MDREDILRVARVDVWYGLSAVAIILVGFSRAIFAAKGWAYYSVNLFFRALIRVRTADGRRRAIEAGVKLGRRSSLTSFQQAKVLKRRAAGETLKALAKSYGVTHPTIIRTLRKVEVSASVG
jgi:DNA invertase Pin-like site-specific DNA recombinase